MRRRIRRISRPIRKMLLGTLMLPLLAGGFTVFVVFIGGLRDSLVEAAGRGDLPTVKRLVAWGVSPNWGGAEDHYTPLGVAAMEGNVEVVQFLLRAGADVNRRDDYGATPLMRAAANGNATIIKMLRSRQRHSQ